MPAWAVKLGMILVRSFADRDVLKKLMSIILVVLLLLFALLFSTYELFMQVPFVTEDGIAVIYQGCEQASDMTKTDHDRTGIKIPWDEVTAVWTIAYEQDFSRLDIAEVQEFALNWAECKESTVTYTDSDGNSWTETIVWYELREMTEVMDIMGFDKVQKEQTFKYLQAIQEGGRPPAEWIAEPMPGWAWPVPGYEESTVISSGFGLRVHPITHMPGIHHGVDIAAPEGTAVVAAIAGTVEETGYDDTLGIYVLIQAHRMETRYGHLSAALVREGEKVTAGTCIGKVGNTGLSTNPHLHFEIKFADIYQNPLQYY